ncbi:MAG: hypothetical protein AB7P17_06335 [Nitrospirales bacterium]|nr:hypothetical protein [Nitrospirales bacterium]
MPHPSPTPRTSLIGFIGFLWMLTPPILVTAGEPITGFRDLKFGMTQQEVTKLNACSSAKECLYELNDKNRYLELLYMGDTTENEALQTALKSPGSGLARISIDMGQYTEAWYNQLQRILGDSYQLTHDISQEQIQAFLGQQLTELTSGYENGQVLLTVARREYGNMIIKVIYQSPEMAQSFVKSKPPS